MIKKLLAGCLAFLVALLVGFSAGVADLSITQSASSPAVVLGSALTYTVTVRNAGPDGASDVVLTDILPAVVKLVSAQSDSGTWTQSANAVVCHLNSLASGAAATLTLTVAPTCAG